MLIDGYNYENGTFKESKVLNKKRTLARTACLLTLPKCLNYKYTYSYIVVK